MLEKRIGTTLAAVVLEMAKFFEAEGDPQETEKILRPLLDLRQTHSNFKQSLTEIDEILTHLNAFHD